MKYVFKWKGDSVSFYTKLEDPPLPLPNMHSPIKLFNIFFDKDGSVYTIYFGSSHEIEEKHMVNGELNHHKIELAPPGKELRISIHGSGEVRSFSRESEEIISHLGFELRSIEQPVLLAQHHIGSAGAYMFNLLALKNPKPNAIILPGIFEQPLQAVFHLHAAPEGYTLQGDGFIWVGLTKPMNNGRKLLISVSLTYEPWAEGGLRDHEIRVFAQASPIIR
jgi:hypothetical protein